MTDYAFVLGDFMSNRKILSLIVAVVGVVILAYIIVDVCHWAGSAMGYKWSVTLAHVEYALSAYRIGKMRGYKAGLLTWCTASLIIMLVPVDVAFWLGGNALLFIPYTVGKLREDGLI
jgi:hypothetical protein